MNCGKLRHWRLQLPGTKNQSGDARTDHSTLKEGVEQGGRRVGGGWEAEGRRTNLHLNEDQQLKGGSLCTSSLGLTLHSLIPHSVTEVCGRAYWYQFPL